MVAGDGLRLCVLSVSSCWNDHRTVEKFGIKGLPLVGRLSTCGCLSELPGYWMGAAPPGCRPSRTALENLAAPRGEPVIQPFPVCGTAYGIHGASLFFPLRAGCLCTSGSHEGSVRFECDWSKSCVAHRALLLAHFCPTPESSAATSRAVSTGSHH